jgi:VanZ family protein
MWGFFMSNAITPSSPDLSPAKPAGHWLWAVAVVATVFIASGRGRVAGPDIVNFDKLVHAAVFGLTATLLARSFVRRRFAWWAVLIVSAYGAADEFHQYFTPGRTASVADWVADTLGASLAVALYQLWPWYHRLLETRLFTRQPRVEKPSAPVLPVVTS